MVVVGFALTAGRAEELQMDRLRRAGRSALGVARPVSPSRALAALASQATAWRPPLTVSLAGRARARQARRGHSAPPPLRGRADQPSPSIPHHGASP